MKYRDVTVIHERFHCMGGMMASLRGHRSSSGMQNDNNLILPTERLPVLWPLFPVSWLLTSSILKHWASFWLGGELSAYLPIFQNQDDVHFQSNRCGQPLIRPSGAVLNTAITAGSGEQGWAKVSRYATFLPSHHSISSPHLPLPLSPPSFPIFLCKNVFQAFPLLAFSKWTSAKVCPLLARFFPLPSKCSQLNRNFEWSSITKANFNKSETYVSINGLSRLLDISPASGCFLSVIHFLENCQLLSQNHGIIELE